MELVTPLIHHSTVGFGKPVCSLLLRAGCKPESHGSSQIHIALHIYTLSSYITRTHFINLDSYLGCCGDPGPLEGSRMDGLQRSCRRIPGGRGGGETWRKSSDRPSVLSCAVRWEGGRGKSRTVQEQRSFLWLLCHWLHPTGARRSRAVDINKWSWSNHSYIIQLWASKNPCAAYCFAPAANWN